MALEDHAGDVVRKARTAARVNREIAAQAAGLTGPELAAFEKNGRIARPVDWTRLAGRLGLAGDRLEAIANGWEPAPVALNRWRELRQVSTTRGDNTVHAYLIWDADSRAAALFDTGWDAAPLLAWLEPGRLDLRQVFFTHAHPDHQAAWPAIRTRFPHAQPFGLGTQPRPAGVDTPGPVLRLGALEIRVRATPGHSPDGATYVVCGFPEAAPAVAMVGDSLLAGSRGWGFQSEPVLDKSVREAILTLPADTLVCPGHGPLTTIGEELAHNPFFG